MLDEFVLYESPCVPCVYNVLLLFFCFISLSAASYFNFIVSYSLPRIDDISNVQIHIFSVCSSTSLCLCIKLYWLVLPRSSQILQ